MNYWEEVADTLETDAKDWTGAINELNEKIKHVKPVSGGVYEMYPDLDNIDMTNLWSTAGLTATWTCDRHGFVQMAAYDQAPNNTSWSYAKVTVNGVTVAQNTDAGSNGSFQPAGGLVAIVKVKPGDVCATVSQVSGGITTYRACRFIPPTFVVVDVETQEATGTPTPIIDWVVEEKHNAGDNQWDYKKYASGRWEGWITRAVGTVGITTANGSVYSGPYITWTAAPAGVTVSRILVNTYDNIAGSWYTRAGIGGLYPWLSTPGNVTLTVQVHASGTWPSPVQPIKLLSLKNTPNQLLVTIPASAWSTDTQPTAVVPGVELDPRVFMFFTSEDPQWESYGIKGYSQTTGSVGFICTGTKPTANVLVELNLVGGSGEGGGGGGSDACPFPVGFGFLGFTAARPEVTWPETTWVDECVGRTPFGYDSSNALFNEAGKKGGNNNLIVPYHTHTSASVALMKATRTNGTENAFNTAYADSTSPIGINYAGTAGNATNANIPAYQTVHFWRRTA